MVRATAWGLVVAVLGAAAGAEASLIGYWKLDDTSGDLPTANATVGPNATYEDFTAAKLQKAPSPGDPAGKSVEFLADGSPYERINLGANGGMASGQSALTMSMWVKIDQLGRDNTFASIGTFGGGSPLIFWRDDDDQGSNKQDTIAVLIGANRTAGVTGVLNDNDWHHVAFTYQANTTGGLKLYFDGVQTGPAVNTTTSAIPGSSGPLALGNASITPAVDKQYDGLLDEVTIWDTALADYYIANLARGVSPFAIPEPSTVLVWSLLAGLGIALGWRRRRRR
jgi:hypothetical protein